MKGTVINNSALVTVNINSLFQEVGAKDLGSIYIIYIYFFHFVKDKSKQKPSIQMVKMKQTVETAKILQLYDTLL